MNLTVLHKCMHCHPTRRAHGPAPSAWAPAAQQRRLPVPAASQRFRNEMFRSSSTAPTRKATCGGNGGGGGSFQDVER